MYKLTGLNGRGFQPQKMKRYVFIGREFNFIRTCAKRWIFDHMHAIIHTDFNQGFNAVKPHEKYF